MLNMRARLPLSTGSAAHFPLPPLSLPIPIFIANPMALILHACLLMPVVTRCVHPSAFT